MGSTIPTVYVVDDDESIRKALGRLLGAAGYRVECYASAEAFLDHHATNAHACAILDLQEQLSAGSMARPIVFLTGQGDVPTSVRAMKGGAVDFLTKPVEAPALLSAVKIALQRDFALRSERENRQDVGDRIANLTPREREVLTHVVAGRLNKQIAADLGIAEKTIKVHRGRMMAKMGVRTVADLVRIVTLHADRRPDAG
jgi:FixJ family two-component response regulator